MGVTYLPYVIETVCHIVIRGARSPATHEPLRLGPGSGQRDELRAHVLEAPQLVEHGRGGPQVEAAGDVGRQDGSLVGGQEGLPEPVGGCVKGRIRGVAEERCGREVLPREVDVPGDERRWRACVGEPEEADGCGEGEEGVDGLEHDDGVVSFRFSVTGFFTLRF